MSLLMALGAIEMFLAKWENQVHWGLSSPASPTSVSALLTDSDEKEIQRKEPETVTPFS